MSKTLYGIKIKGDLTVKNLKIIYGEREVIIFCSPHNQRHSNVDFFACLLHYLKKPLEIKVVFGLFLDGYMSFTRIKMRDNFAKSFNYENLTSLLESNNLEAWYSEDRVGGEFHAIEIRYTKDTNFIIENELYSLLKEMRDEKKKIFNSYE